ncbi:MAG: arylesterase, partial [Cardiobacteriaceae bacterium]|nr:arylesterase [Cardiobacteriaceae bacterium]
LKKIITTIQAQGADIILIGIPKLSVASALGFPDDHPLYNDIAKTENLPYFANGWAKVLKNANWKSDQIPPNADGYK